jgi:hypothetical protein
MDEGGRGGNGTVLGVHRVGAYVYQMTVYPTIGYGVMAGL